MTKTVLVPLAEGTEELEAVTVIDLLRRAGAHVTVASVAATAEITGSRGTHLRADALIGEVAAQTFDLIAVPGGAPGAERLRDSAPLTALLIRQHREGRLYAAICAAPVVVLQTHGLLAGRRATCFPDFAARLENPVAAGAPVVVDGPCITGQGVGSAILFALHLIAALYDSAQAQAVADRIVFAWEG